MSAVTDDDLDRLAEKVDAAVGEVRGLPEDARRRALALKTAVEEVHKVGLTKIVRALKADPRGKEILFELVDDPAVRMLFAMHGLIKLPDPPPAPPGELIQLGRMDRTNSEQGWIPGPAIDDISEGRAVALDTPGAKVVLLKAAGGVRAYRNECAHQGLPLDGGMIDPDANTISCPWHGFRFDCDTGECLTAPAAQLVQYPVRIENGVVWVRPE